MEQTEPCMVTAARDQPPTPRRPDPLSGRPSGALEVVRREHLHAEANVKGVALLAILAGVDFLRAWLFGMTAGDGATAFLWLAFGGAAITAGGLLFGLHPIGRVLYAVTAMLTLGVTALASPVALKSIGIQLVLLAVCFYALFNRRADVVCSHDYCERVIPATPAMRPQPSRAAMVVFFLLVAAMVCLPA